MAQDIVVRKTKDGWKASLADNKKVKAKGQTKAEAVGNLVIAASGLLGIAILGD